MVYTHVILISFSSGFEPTKIMNNKLKYNEIKKQTRIRTLIQSVNGLCG